MANIIQVKRGANASLPILNAAEFGFSTDTIELHIGDGTTNYEVALGKIPSIATGIDIDLGIDDIKYITAAALLASNNVPSVAPGDIGNILVSDGDRWVSGINSSNGASVITQTFNGDTDWGIAVDGLYSLEITHPESTDVAWQVTRDIQSVYNDEVNPYAEKTNSTTLTLKVSESPDGRFAGSVSLFTAGVSTIVKANSIDIDLGTNDSKFLTAKSAKDSHNIPSVVPGTAGNILVSDGTDWTSAASSGGNNITDIFTAGESLVAGDLCYLKSDGKMWKANANTEATTKGMIVLCNATISANATGVFIIIGRYSTTGLTPGSTYYISTTTGGITATAPATTGKQVRVIGYALSATILYFVPSQTYLEVT